MNNEFMSTEINALSLSLSKAQKAIENVGKDKQAYGYKYADLASCLEAIKIPLSDNGLAISQLISQNNDKQVLITLLMHESGQWLKSVFQLENVTLKQGNSIQHFGAGITYARRYALSAIIGLAQDDTDAQHSTKAKRKEDIAEKLTLDINLTESFIQKCKAEGIDVKEFAKFAGVDSLRIETIEHALNNFESLKTSFLEVIDANT